MQNPRPRLFPVLACLLLLALAGCDDARPEAGRSAHHDNSAAASAEAALKAAPAHLLFSPNGEPLNGGALGRPVCGEAVKAWFDRLDAKHDGHVGRDALLADARVQFQRMDIDHTGVLVPAELARYRAPFRDALEHAKPPRAEKKQPEAANGSDDERHGGRGHHRREEGGEGFSDLVADPVMSADTNLDNRVTLDEFLAHAGESYAALAKDDKTGAETPGGFTLQQADKLCRPGE